MKTTTSNRKLVREWYKKTKEESSCKICSESHPATLEFHHRNPEDKVDTISKMVYKGRPLKEIFEEAAKCDIICSNCHKKTHYEWNRTKKGKDPYL